MRVVVCGGRDFDDKIAVDLALNELLYEVPVDTLRVIQGGASGADALVRQWCVKHEVEYINVPADWKTHGRAAGPIRNQKMLDTYTPELCIAFPGGRGTTDMVKRCLVANVPVRSVL